MEEMFRVSNDVLGDRNLALLWKNRWCNNAPGIVAPDLCQAVRPGMRNTRTVAATTHSKQWIRDITGRSRSQRSSSTSNSGGRLR